MSGGMEDARGVGEIGVELEEAAEKLCTAIERAQRGHRGLSVPIKSTVNGVMKLAKLPYRLVEYTAEQYGSPD